jgi:hypothetical protein
MKYGGIGYAGFLMGFLIVFVGFFMNDYSTEQGATTSYPYAAFSLPLILVGYVLIAIGTGFLWRSKREEPTVSQSQTPHVPPPPPSNPEQPSPTQT